MSRIIRKQSLFIAGFGLVAGLVGTANADWPTSPDSPLVVGFAEGVFGPRLSIVTTDDQASWISWQDSFCGGQVRLQRVGFDGTLLINEGLLVQDDPTCGFTLPPMMTAIGSSVAVSRAQSGILEFPVQRYQTDGLLEWENGFSSPSQVELALGGLATLSNGDVMVVSRGFNMINVDRVNGIGETVWDSTTSFSAISANFRVFSIVPDLTGGAFIFWDRPLTYTRLITVMHIADDGTTSWDEPLYLVEAPPGVPSSRHTDPVAVPDGQGGAILVWTKGTETASTPVPSLIQRIDQDRNLTFPIEGVRISEGTRRQYFVNVNTDPQSGDLFIVWRDGFLDEMTLRAQRMTLDGDKLWGDEGVEIGLIDRIFDDFDVVWNNNQLSTVIGGKSGVVMHNVSADGQLQPEQWVVSTQGPTSAVQAKNSGDGIIITWQADGEGLNDLVVAQRVNPNGRLGGPPCNRADMNFDFQLNFFDVSTFLNSFGNHESIADLTGDGEFNFFDVSDFLAVFAHGCP
ncbi:MAG: hypothetical protein P1U42_07125 [Phycisphaerales bacterium]|nr:hypothetical protein [Phycisphaerales bacterium]